MQGIRPTNYPVNNNTCCQSRLHIQGRLGLSNHYACTATAFPCSKLDFYTPTLLPNPMTLNCDTEPIQL